MAYLIVGTKQSRRPRLGTTGPLQSVFGMVSWVDMQWFAGVAMPDGNVVSCSTAGVAEPVAGAYCGFWKMLTVDLRKCCLY